MCCRISVTIQQIVVWYITPREVKSMLLKDLVKSEFKGKERVFIDLLNEYGNGIDTVEIDFTDKEDRNYFKKTFKSYLNREVIEIIPTYLDACNCHCYEIVLAY